MSERSRIMELEREVVELQLRLQSSQQTEGAVSLSPEELSDLKARSQSQEKKVGRLIVLVKKHPLNPSPRDGRLQFWPAVCPGFRLQPGLGSSLSVQAFVPARSYP